MIIAELVIPQMFTAYAEDMKYLSNGLHQFQYFCEECDQAFASAWGRIPGSMSMYERGTYFNCPYCGKRHGDNVAYVNRNEVTPNKVRLAVKAYKSSVIFEINCDSVYFDDLFSVRAKRYKETFKFDLSKQIVTFSKTQGKNKADVVEIGNPFDLSLLQGTSILRFFLPNSLANTKQKAALSSIIKTLRETVQGMLEKRLCHKVKSMFVSPGQRHGSFLHPIFNIAYRVRYPDALNLTAIYRETPRNIEYYWGDQMIIASDSMYSAIELTRPERNIIDAMITLAELPDKTTVRRILTESIFNIGKLGNAFEICSNYDYAIRLYDGFKKLTFSRYDHIVKPLIEFLKALLPVYGEAGVVQLVEFAFEVDLKDCVNLYNQLNEENRRAIVDEKVKIKDLHDWMAKRHRIQNHVNLRFNVPDHIVKRLSMQKDKLKFFLPQESLELLEAGAELHNCVASYGTAVKNNRKWIVLVASDNGRLSACIEVVGKEVVQAKIDRNKPVHTDVKLNAEIVTWAKEANLAIKTSDVKIISENAIVSAVC